MTRRIATAVLLTSWIALLGAGAATYLLVRASLLEELDQSIITRASVLVSQKNGNAPLPTEDRYLVKNEHGQTLLRSDPLKSGSPPEVLSREFAGQADGSRLRTLSLRFHNQQGAAMTVVYSSSAERFDLLRRKLLMILIVTTVIGFVTTSLIAVFMSRLVTRPLTNAAQTLGQVDEWNLKERLDPSLLPAELRQVADRLNAMLQRLDEAFARQRRFLADAAHELRTPVTALRTGIEVTLRRPRTADELKSVLTRSLTTTEKLSELVLQLLSIAKTGREAQPRIDVVDVIKLIRDTVAEAKPLADEKKIDLRVSAPADQCRLNLASDSLSSVLMNLLSNAIQYTPAGGVITVSATVSDSTFRLEVVDTGAGIDETHLPHVFEPFYRADPSRGSSAGNLGLGLYLTQLNVAKMKGKISCTSAPGAGTAFLVEIPASRADLAKEPKAPLMVLS